MSNFKFGTKSVARLKTIDSDLSLMAELALEICEIDFGIPPHGGRRTPDEQNVLFKEGATKADGFKTLSYHQSGMALDFYAYVDGKASWELCDLRKVVEAFRSAELILMFIQYELEFGIDWKNSWDAGHVQMRRIGIMD